MSSRGSDATNTPRLCLVKLRKRLLKVLLRSNLLPIPGVSKYCLELAANWIFEFLFTGLGNVVQADIACVRPHLNGRVADAVEGLVLQLNAFIAISG